MYICRKHGNKQLSSSIYLSEAEPFLEQYAKRSPQNQALVGAAGSFVKSEDFLAITDGGDEEGDLEQEKDVPPLGHSISIKDTVTKDEGLIVFFPGIVPVSPPPPLPTHPHPQLFSCILCCFPALHVHLICFIPRKKLFEVCVSYCAFHFTKCIHEKGTFL